LRHAPGSQGVGREADVGAHSVRPITRAVNGPYGVEQSVTQLTQVDAKS